MLCDYNLSRGCPPSVVGLASILYAISQNPASDLSREEVEELQQACLIGLEDSELIENVQILLNKFEEEPEEFPDFEVISEQHSDEALHFNQALDDSDSESVSDVSDAFEPNEMKTFQVEVSGQSSYRRFNNPSLTCESTYNVRMVSNDFLCPSVNRLDESLRLSQLDELEDEDTPLITLAP